MHIKGDKLMSDAGSDCGADIAEDAKTIREINNRLREVVEKAPSDASVQFILRRVSVGAKMGFKGLLRIRSSHNRFVSGASGEKLFEVVNTILNEVSGQIRGWKRTRELQAVSSASVWE
jgi:hypothetical protein